MPHVTCPNCQGTATLMPVLSDISDVDFYQCGTCKTVSLTPKAASGPAVPFVLTPADAGEFRHPTRI